MTGLGISSLVYYGCCYFFPPPGMNKKFEEIDESENEPRFGEESANSTVMDSAFERYDSADLAKKDTDGLGRRKKDTDVTVHDV